jgi:hypothetical protein
LLAQQGAEPYRSVVASPYIFFDPSYVSAERAEQVRCWRVNHEMTWRAVAQAATDAWGSDYGSNQLFGEELCRLAAVMLGQDPSSEPWN